MYNLNFSDFDTKLDLKTFVRRELIPMLENDQFIDWDVVATEDLESLLVEFYTHTDCGDHLSDALFMEADGAEMSEALMRFAFGGNLQDIIKAKEALHNAMFDALKTYLEKLANDNLGVW
jgi:hypothetical protein